MRLLQKYKLLHFVRLSDSVKQGNLIAFNEEMNRYQEVFIHKGTYLILEKLKTLIYRNLFKKIYQTVRKDNIPISQFEIALAWLGVEMDRDEVECILANLIFQKLIKGWISHKAGVLVLSPKDPFPKPFAEKK